MEKRLTLIIENQDEHLVVRNIVLKEGKKEKVLEDKQTTLKYTTYSWRDLNNRRYEFKRNIDESFESSYRRLLFMYPTYDICDVNDNLLHAGKSFTLDTYLKSLNRKKPKKIALATIGGAGHLYFGMSNDVMALESADQELLSYVFTCGMDENYIRYFAEYLQKTANILIQARTHATEHMLLFSLPKTIGTIEKYKKRVLEKAQEATKMHTPLLQRDVLYCDILPISGIHRIFVNGRDFRGYWDEEEYLNHRYEIRGTKYTTTEEI